MVRLLLLLRSSISSVRLITISLCVTRWLRSLGVVVLITIIWNLYKIKLVKLGQKQEVQTNKYEMKRGHRWIFSFSVQTLKIIAANCMKNYMRLPSCNSSLKSSGCIKNRSIYFHCNSYKFQKVA